MSEPNKSPNKEAPADSSEEVQDTWEAGLRRRRGRNSSNNNNTPQRENEGRSNGSANRNERAQNNGTRPRPSFASPGPAANGGNFTTGFGTPCGSGGGGVGFLTSPVPGPTPATPGTPFGNGGGATPYKTPTKDNNELVAVTPSSVSTAGETAESTLLSQSPLRIRRRSRSNSLSNPNLQRQYQLLRSQIMLLLGSASLGLMLFLFYALPLAAFISLGLMLSSAGALVPVARSILRARYELEMEHPLGLTRYLPESLRVMLTETSLHDFMTDDRFFMENRYMLLYFMPGLQNSELMNYIDQLPPRHREALLQPGLGMLMPSFMENLMRLDNNGNNTGDANEGQMRNGGDDSTASGLTIGHDHHYLDGEEGGADAEVTLLDAVAGLPRTLAGFALDNGLPGGALPPIPETPAGPPDALQTQLPGANHPSDNVANQAVDGDDNSSFDFSIDISATGLPLEDGDADEVPATPLAATNNAELQNVIVELPQQSDDRARENEEEVQQQERDLEGRILSEAASAAMSNFATQASAAARETASEAVDTTSSTVVRVGAFTGLIAGGGGIVAAVLANQQTLVVTLGSMVGSIRNTGTASSTSGSNANASTSLERRTQLQSNEWVQGLFATSAFGFASAGIAYLIRNRVRSNIAAKRETRLKNEQDRKDEGEL